MNGIGSSGSRSYREVTRTVHQESSPASGRDTQVQYLSAANPTTVVSERASSPMNPGSEQRSMAYKTVSYQYNTTEPKPVSGVLSGNSIISSSSTDSTSDARLRQNLNELDSLLVDLHQAQKTGFGTPQGTATTTRTDVVTRGIDPGLLESVEHISPAPPTRQQQHVSRSVQYKYNTQQYSGDSTSPLRYQTDSTPSPRLQPKRSSSAQRELTYGEPIHTRTTRSPSPMRQRDLEPSSSPRVPHRSAVQKEVYYETKSNSTIPSSTHSATMPHERYRDKSPSNQRLQREMYYENKSSTTIPPSPRQERYRDMSPPSQRRGISPIRPVQTMSPDPYPAQPDGSSRITTVRTYNYSTSGGAPQPHSVTHSPYPGTSPSPIPVSRSPYPDNSVSIVELPRTPHRSPSPSPAVPSVPPHHVPGQPTTKVTTTVRTYTYELPGQPGINQPYPVPGPNQPYPAPGPNQPYPVPSPNQPYPVPSPNQPYPVPSPNQPYPVPSPNQPYPVPSPNQPYLGPADPNEYGPGTRTLTYHVSPQQPLIPREKEPLILQPTEPQPPTVITYKYSSHSSHNSTNKYPGQPHPEEHQPLLPRPFPTSSPTPGHPGDSQPPKRLDDLMASFSDSEREALPPPGYYTAEKQMSTRTQNMPPHENGVAVVPPTTNVKIDTKTENVIKERMKTKNVAGPPVYYPPGVELFAQKEESMKASKKASGKYKYEYESGSKSKSSSGGGAAVVPVCLPLCCAMPCVIL